MTMNEILKRMLACCFAVLVCGSGMANGQDPVLHWTFDEADGDALDSGFGDLSPGVLQSTATRTNNTPGGFSAAAIDLSAPGLDSWVMGTDADKVDTLESFTLTTWLYLQGWNDGGSSNQRLVAKQDGTAAFNGFSWNLNGPNEGDVGPDNFRLGLFVGGDGFEGDQNFGAGFSTEDLGAFEEWTFVAVTYDGETDDPEENVRFYVGDEFTAVGQLGEGLDFLSGPVSSTAGLATVNVGYTDAAPGNDFAVNGFQDDVRIYAEVLDLDQLDAVRLANLEGSLDGDFDADGSLDADDLDVLAQYITDGNTLGDVDGNGTVNAVDREFWVSDLQNSWVGDSNFDGEFNSGDFVTVFTVGKYESGDVAGYAEGDWNGDKVFDSGDFVAAFSVGGYEQGPRAATAAVPEPSSLLLALLGVCGLLARRSGFC